MIHYMLLLGYILVTCYKNNIVTLHVTFMLYRRNKTCLLGNYRFRIFDNYTPDCNHGDTFITEIGHNLSNARL